MTFSNRLTNNPCLIIMSSGCYSTARRTANSCVLTSSITRSSNLFILVVIILCPCDCCGLICTHGLGVTTGSDVATVAKISTCTGGCFLGGIVGLAGDLVLPGGCYLLLIGGYKGSTLICLTYIVVTFLVDMGIALVIVSIV